MKYAHNTTVLAICSMQRRYEVCTVSACIQADYAVVGLYIEMHDEYFTFHDFF